MRLNDIVVISLLFILIGLVGSGLFYIGRRYERKAVEKYIPVVMEGVCNECEEVGEAAGYKKGLNTCDDIVDNMNNKGPR
jgi:hypothetical protein